MTRELWMLAIQFVLLCAMLWNWIGARRNLRRALEHQAAVKEYWAAVRSESAGLVQQTQERWDRLYGSDDNGDDRKYEGDRRPAIR